MQHVVSVILELTAAPSLAVVLSGMSMAPGQDWGWMRTRPTEGRASVSYVLVGERWKVG
jgi:hypothetical protein